MVNSLERMKELVAILNEAGKIYYQGRDEIMSNLEYDRLYDELASLEKEENIILAGSPTGRVGYEVVSALPKERHGHPVLSLDKTKDVETLRSWLGENDGVLSWKLDGLTVVVTYENGMLTKAVTRGNGEVGEVITNNAKTFVNIPIVIPFKGKVVLRGEAIIKYKDFEKINALTLNPEDRYKNPRNLCSGSVRQLNNEITAKRNVYFIAYTILELAEEFDKKSDQLEWMKEQGFDVVGYDVVTKRTLDGIVTKNSEQIKTNEFPSDGLVLTYNDIAYGESLGRTSKFPRHSIAFKWADETAETHLKEVEWSASRTGLINPVAIFEPVELEGTTVSRASVHNISILEELQLGIGDIIKVYKANMIIPQIAENMTKSGNVSIPKTCPICGQATKIRQENGVKTLICLNADCLAKKIKSFTHFVSREAMNIDGLSEATIEKFIAAHFISSYIDIFHLNQHKDEIVKMQGYGEKSYQNLQESIDRAKSVMLANFIYSLGIVGIGLSNAKIICKEYNYDIDALLNADVDSLQAIDGIGDVLAKEWVSYMSDEKHRAEIEALCNEITLIRPDQEGVVENLSGINIVITGSLTNYSSRTELKNIIEGHGGKVTGSVTGKTNYLINNDNTSSSSKNKKAKELGVTIITEDEFIKLFLL